jgi:small subunit ribosomal protein S4
MADHAKGVTGENLLSRLERRLDSAVYRMGFGTTRNDSRQLVRHGHVNVNGKLVNIPSYQVRPGDKIAIRESSKALVRVQTSLEVSGRREQPEWLDVNRDGLEASVRMLPPREALTLPIEEQMIVEFYSR